MYERLRAIRKANKYTVKELVKELGLKTEPAYFKKETGATRFTVEEALILARLFKTTVEKLFA